MQSTDSDAISISSLLTLPSSNVCSTMDNTHPTTPSGSERRNESNNSSNSMDASDQPSLSSAVNMDDPSDLTDPSNSSQPSSSGHIVPPDVHQIFLKQSHNIELSWEERSRLSQYLSNFGVPSTVVNSIPVGNDEHRRNQSHNSTSVMDASDTPSHPSSSSSVADMDVQTPSNSNMDTDTRSRSSGSLTS